MLYYIYVVLAVLVAIGIGVTGIMLIRRGRRAAEEMGPPPSRSLFGDDEGGSVAAPAVLPATPWTAEPQPARPQGSLVDVPVAVPAAPAMPAAAPAAMKAPAERPVERPFETTIETPAGAGDAAAADPTFLEDPLGTVIFDLVDGKGTLANGDLKRLDVFRPERIHSAVQSIQFPPRLQQDEDALMRLAQVQLYAATLELRAKWTGYTFQKPGSSDAPLSARDFKLKIARDIMDLPPADRAEVIGYLLGGLLNSPGTTTALKRAVIDTLEHLQSVALTNILLECLDDPDPIVQEYALAAAERLLGD